MQISLKYHRPTPVSSCCVKGAYARSAPEAWEKMRAFVAENALRARVIRAIGCYMDDPAATAAADLCYRACIDLGADPPSGSNYDVCEEVFPGGVYASLAYEGDACGVGKVLSQIKRDWLPSQPMEIDSSRPFIEIYDTGKNLSYHGDFAAELGIPVLIGIHSQATTAAAPAKE